MTSETLSGTLKFLDLLDKRLGLQGKLEAVQNALNQLVSAPAQPQHQSTLASALADLQAASAQLATSITPSQATLTDQMGGEGLFTPDLYDRVKDSIAVNAMTPSVARDFVQELTQRRATFMATVRGALASLEKLGVTSSEVDPGTADISFLIPRDLFENHLGDFATELKFIDRLVRDVSEAQTGTAQPVELKALSSSVPTVALAAAALVIDKLGTLVNKFLDAWKKLEEIRAMRAKMKSIGMGGGNIEEEFDQKITSVIDEVVEESTTFVMTNYKGEIGRRNELQSAIHQDMRRLFGQIERGLQVEVRAKPSTDKDGSEGTALQRISDLSHKMQFPTVASEPLLLESGEVLEGEIKIRHSKKTTSTKTVKIAKKSGKSETEPGKQD